MFSNEFLSSQQNCFPFYVFNFKTKNRSDYGGVGCHWCGMFQVTSNSFAQACGSRNVSTLQSTKRLSDRSFLSTRKNNLANHQSVTDTTPSSSSSASSSSFSIVQNLVAIPKCQQLWLQELHLLVLLHSPGHTPSNPLQTHLQRHSHLHNPWYEFKAKINK